MSTLIPAGVFWAKLHPRENPSSYHPLLAHSSDVAAVLGRLLRPGSVLGARLAHSCGLDVLPPELAMRLVYVAALHDLGKVNHSFQDQWRPGVGRSKGHVQVVLKSLNYGPLQEVWKELLATLALPPREAHELLRTAVCHHGRPWDPAPNPVIPIWQERSDRDPLAEIRKLAELARGWSGLGNKLGAELPPLTPRFLHLFAGTLTLADWIGSTLSAFDFEPWADQDPDRYWQLAQRRADHACSIIGLTSQTRIISAGGKPLRGVSLLVRVFPSIFGDRCEGRFPSFPTPLQKHVADMELPPLGSRVLIESETGSGKTEAALALYARLRAADRVGGLVFALPTRATASAMYKRIAAAVDAMYEPSEQPTLALAMGGEQARLEIVQGQPDSARLLTDAPVSYPDAAERELIHWSSSSAKKFFAAEIVVGTIDQLLLGGLAVKHAHLRLAAFSRHLLVVDELHSYDRYMAEVLQCVLDMHSAAGGSALLMSATLSDRERLRFAGLIQDDTDDQTPFAEAVARPYPLVSVCARPGESWTDAELTTAAGQSRAWENTDVSEGGADRAANIDAVPTRIPKPPLRWRLCEEDEGLEEAIRAARGGARVCVLRNTVKGARATMVQLFQRLGEDEALALLWRPDGATNAPAYHSRYTLPDRKVLDAGVLASYARGGTAGDGRILVATQVAEQSLDVDFDLMVTDLCPVDVLLQRLGRVWRHRERDAARPAVCREVQAWVIEPGAGLEPLLGRKFGGENGWGTVYSHLGFLELTRQVIRERPAVELPRDNRALIEAVYHTAPLSALRASSEEWESHFREQEGQSLGRELTAKSVTLRFDDSYIDNSDRFNRDIAGPVRSRLGDDRVKVLLPAPLRGFYDRTQTVDSVDLPWNALSRAGVPNEALDEPRASAGAIEHDSVNYHLHDFRFRYRSQGWEW